MQKFSSYLSQNPTLQRLKIDFYGYKQDQIINFIILVSWRGITDKGLQSFAQEICQKSVNLKDFTVLFGE